MKRYFSKFGSIKISIATKLILSFLLIIFVTSVVFTFVGIQLIGNRIVSEAQEKVRNDLNSAREIYLSKLNHVYDMARLTADRYLVISGLISGNMEQANDQLVKIRDREELDVLTITDKTGNVIFRTSNPALFGDDQSQDELVQAVLSNQVPVAATMIVTEEALRKESPLLAEQAFFKFIDTPKARTRPETEETAGMMLRAAAPIFDDQNNLIGIVYGGVLINRNYEIVDRIKATVYQNIIYKGKDIGTATIFQDDVRISTNVKNEDSTRAIGTRIAENVYNQVIIQGEPWIGRAYVVNNWYITAYEPIRDLDNHIIGILYVGLLEEKYSDVRRQTILAFVAITLIGALVAMLLSYLISQRISVPIKKLAFASREVAHGNLNTKVSIASKDELGELAVTFNAMAVALKDRDEKLKEFTRKKIMESEKLALVGQLAANVAHELNNPLQGIVTYSHLLLEKNSCDPASEQNLQKIVIQANRCRDIIRALLDFSRQRKPDKTLCNLNSLLQECLSLLEKQALFHNVQMSLDLDDNLPMIVIDPSQIERVFINLIVNAAEAMNGDGSLHMSTRGVPEEQSIEIGFTDTGPGISEENLEKIFDPFFTTKETGHGVGLGLAISYGIVKEHNGAILVESEAGKGTTFIVRLPVTTKEPGTSNEQ